MNYFLPFATSALQAERIHRRIADRVTSLGYAISSERIYEINYRDMGMAVHEAVGAISANGETVLAIFKGPANYFICTYSRGVVWGEPMLACPTSTDSVECFDDEAGPDVG
ncbi:hypothetical protein J2I47_02675 [Fibrella sp. HMF5335]|uniref:Uncharacterized protein n=1 Tax=Fibrella rubiginis TaxID=2817060 RepID=A0A939GDW8_9BACT|nr:hypothetical protein [Fibrella rubiginis]MBO0935444.1 hypothetical protein [Fibrella rubiginis]